MKYSVGTQFMKRGKAKKVCTVVDYYVTRNLKDEIVKEVYVAEHEFMGQTLRDEYPQISIDMGLIEQVAA